MLPLEPAVGGRRHERATERFYENPEDGGAGPRIPDQEHEEPEDSVHEFYEQRECRVEGEYCGDGLRCPVVHSADGQHRKHAHDVLPRQGGTSGLQTVCAAAIVRRAHLAVARHVLRHARGRAL